MDGAVYGARYRYPVIHVPWKASQRISLIAGTKTSGAHSRVASGGDWEMVKAAIGDYLEEERSWHGKGLERALWFVFAVARSRGAKARYRRQRGRPGLVAAQYFQSVGVLFHTRYRASSDCAQIT